MNPLPTLDAAMIDLDGTMVDTLPDFAVAIGLMLDELGQPAVSAAVVSALIGKGGDHLVGAVLEHVSGGTAVDAGLVARGRERYRSLYGEVNGRHAAVYPGVVEGLAALRKRGLRLACLTNKPTAFARSLLATTGLGGHFEIVHGGDLFERIKPDPMPLVKTCEALGTVPSRTLMVGDSSNDARAARAAGCPVVLATYGYNHGEPVRGVDADGFFDSLVEVSEWLAAGTR
ncbi:MAG: phosphoglycolate phosphatase [Caldimonas sp.]